MSTTDSSVAGDSGSGVERLDRDQEDSEGVESSTVYRGYRNPENPVSDECRVRVNGEELARRYDLLSASPSGYEWGYSGSGPAQLAIAILAHECGDRTAADRYQEFNQDVVAKLPELRWEVSGDEVREFLTDGGLPAAVSDA